MASALQFVAIASEAICFIAAVYFIKPLKNTILAKLPWVLGFIFISDFFGLILTQVVFKKNQLVFNIPYYNLTTALILVFWIALIYQTLKNNFYKKILRYSLFVFIAFYFCNIIFIQSFLKSLHTYSFTLGSFVLCLAAYLYLKQLIESDRIIYLKKDVMFWICTGLLSFYVINIPYMAMFNYLLEHHLDLLTVIRNVTIFLMYFMYLCIFLGLLCLKEKLYSVSS
ncbi:MAG: hypothetical protein IPM34_11350 [Saprospiraceae bacterium]|nr:hypothetical protein [Saprospiraceae bacterium]